MSRKLLALAALLATGALQAGSLTLPEAMREAARSSYRADAARLEKAKAREDTAQVRSLYLPEVQFQGGHLNLEHQPQLVSAPMAFGPVNLGPITLPRMELGSLVNPLGDTASWRYKLSVQYLIYDFGKRDKALGAARTTETIQYLSAAGVAGSRVSQTAAVHGEAGSDGVAQVLGLTAAGH